MHDKRLALMEDMELHIMQQEGDAWVKNDKYR
jgi:hypothetical protein